MGLEERLLISDTDTSRPPPATASQNHLPTPTASTSTTARLPDPPYTPAVHHSHGLPIVPGRSENATNNDNLSHGYTRPGPDDQDLPPPRKRRRPALSCEPCRRRKVRCDRQQPCGPCFRMGVASSCEYDNRFPRQSLPPGANEFSTLPNAAMFRRLSQSRLPDASPGPPIFEHEPHHSFAPGRSLGSAYAVPQTGDRSTPMNGLQHTTRDHQDRLHRSEQHSAAGKQPAGTQDRGSQQMVDSLVSRLEQLEQRLATFESCPPARGLENGVSVALATPRVLTNDAATKFWGPTHYMHLFDPKTDIFGRLLSAAPKFDAAKALVSTSGLEVYKQVRRLQRPYRSRQHAPVIETIPQVLETVPYLDLQVSLVEHYVRTLELIWRILHMPSFRKQHEQYANRLEQAPLVFVIQLLLVLSIGAVFAEEHVKINLQASISRWIYAAQTWLTGPLEKSQFGEAWCQCWCLLILARHANSVGTEEQNYVLAGSMVRAAYTVGVNLDAKHLPGLNAFRAQTRKRLWAAVLELTLMISCDASMPPLLSTEDFDCEAPANFNDTDMDEVYGFVEAERIEPERVATHASMQILLLRSFATRLEVARSLNALKSPLSYDKALQLSDDLDRACHEANEFYDSCAKSNSAIQPTFLHRAIISATLHSTQLQLHRAFLAQSKTEPRFLFSRRKAMESALFLLTQLDGQDLQSPIKDDFCKLTTSGLGFFKSCLSFSAIGVLSQETMMQIEEARSSAVPARFSAPPYKLMGVLKHIRAQCLNLIKGGDTNNKKFGYLSITISMIEAAEQGKPATQTVSSAFLECWTTVKDVLRAQGAVEQPGAFSRDSASAAGEYNRSPVMSAHMGDIDFGTDPNWLLNVWNFGPGLD